MASPHNDNVFDEEFAKTVEKIQDLACTCSCNKNGKQCFCLRDQLYPPPDSKSLYLIPFPFMSITASRNEFVLIHSETVCASVKLRRRVVRYMQEHCGWKRGSNAKLTTAFADHSDEIGKLKFIDCCKDLTDGSARDDFGKLPMLSSRIWYLLDKWCVFHLTQVRAEAKETEVAKSFVDWNKPLPVLPKPKDWNSVSKFEEEMFGDMDPETFLAFVQGKNDLGLSDLHKIMENWFRLYSGRDLVIDSHENEVAAVPCHERPSNYRAESNHWLQMPGFYRPKIRRVTNDAKNWTWWSRGKFGCNNNYY